MSTFAELWAQLAPVGRDPGTGGYLRYAYTPAEALLRDWFLDQARGRGLAVEQDGNGNLFAWWGDPAAGDAVLTGSHLDSVPHGGAYDGPLGVVSALLAVDELRARGFAPARPIGVAVFAEEEGSRFGLACLGSRLFTGAVDPNAAAALTDRDGVTLAQAMGAVPAGARPDLLARLGCYVELHVEQGRALVDLDRAVGVATAIWPHGRWRLDFRGEANHAGTTLMADRRDPMLTFAATVLAADAEARRLGAHATIGRVQVAPNATNAIPSLVSAWLDARADAPDTMEAVVAAVYDRAQAHAREDGTKVSLTAESVSPETEFHVGLRDRLAKVLDGAPVLPTGAGHDAGVLSALLPTAMLFVRNPTGVSHSPAEHASDADCEAGVRALADVLQELAC
ncbi:Zn-dependent hydrolase [Catellatospora sp. TT07R-123]|uniref:allantoate amidohydrolase n=1 Tax=Catellatospora sp. TT07R-123 TaxID=2733863 RepID=UPI001B0AA5F6|nr:allantoate amidohydrolase [Catellatospora sp. TT07R-123]GHJ45694.1 Zn-dependent hydrolase [Catellatospora sp. TT07R-123]